MDEKWDKSQHFHVQKYLDKHYIWKHLNIKIKHI